MKGIVFIFILCCASSIAFCQDFELVDALESGVVNGKMITSDLNVDGLLDLLITGKNDSGEFVTRIFSINLDGEPDSMNNDLPGFQNRGLALSDLNNDGYNDILISGIIDSIPSFNVFWNNFNFKFTQDEDWPDLAGNVHSGDFNNDGRMDVVFSGKNEVNEQVSMIWLQEGNDFIEQDSSGFQSLNKFELLDFNNDNYTDVLVSKSLSEDVVSLKLLENNGSGYFSIVDQAFENYIKQPLFAKGDFSQNGEMDLVVGGERAGNYHIDLYLNQADNFILDQSIPIGSMILDLIAVDITNDGLMDIILVTDNSVMLLQNKMDSLYVLPILDSLSGGSIAIGDFDRDYDQDLFVTGKRDGSHGTWIFKNTAQSNLSPNFPLLDSAFLTTDGFVVRWYASSDDTTPPQSLSYKVVIWNDFSLFNATNWTISEYGPMEMGTDYMFKEILPGNYNINLLAVDNSLITSFSLPLNHVFAGMCGNGSGGCLTYSINPEIEVCKNEPIVIPSPNSEPVIWYSQMQDSLGSASNLSYRTDVNDVLFTSYNDSNDCKIYWYQKVNVRDSLSLDIGLIDSLSRCLGERVEMTELVTSNEPVAGMEWLISENGSGVVPLLFPYNISSDANIFLRLYDQDMCLWDSVKVIARPLPDIDAGEDVTVVLGGSVQLNATGGNSYQWSPSSGLSDSTIANPICRPVNDIEYTVTGIGENGCENQDAINITVTDPSPNIVGPKLFVPNLFSPNNDGSNDVFRILGDINRVQEMTFRIFSNSGSLLFESSDLVFIQKEGWDGNTNGQPMPVGTYIWSVVGRFDNGERVTIEGQDSGLVTLAR